MDLAIIPLDQGRFGLLTLFGNPNTKTEQLRDFETGYRAQVNKHLSVDFTGFPGNEALDLTLLISGCEADSLAEARRFGAAPGAWGEAGAGRDDRRGMAGF